MISEMSWHAELVDSIGIRFFTWYCCIGCALALTSNECMRAWPGFTQECVAPTCGYLEGAFTTEGFADTLTPSCQAIVQHFSAREHVMQWIPTRDSVCPTYEQASRPTNPVVVQTGVTPTFVMCTVPKAGCSQLRTLLLAMTRFPSPISWIGEEWRVHMAPYPSLHMFEQTPGAPDSAVPKFIIGRHPYTRVLSGFLDKMTWTQSHGKDWHTLQHVNLQLGREEAELFDATQDGFRDFLIMLSKLVLAGTPANEHFEPMVNVCDVASVRYHYFLRLEDMPTWFPCLRAGLKIGRFSDTGWDHSRKFHSDWYSEYNEKCWWSPKGMSCPVYAEMSQSLLQGSISEITVDTVGGHEHDIHATSADAKWRDFYTQELADMVYQMYKTDFDLFGYSRQLSSLE